MATNDPKSPHAASNPGSGRRGPAPGPNDSSDTFTDMPSKDHKVDISSADDVDVDKDIPADGESMPDSPPDAVPGGG